MDKSIFDLIWRIWAVGMRQNTHTRFANDLATSPVIPGMMVFCYILILLKYGAFLTKQRFRRKHARHQVVFKSAMGKLTPGTVRSFHVFGEKGGLL